MLVARNFKILRKKDVAQPTSWVIPLVAQVPLQQNMLNQKMFYRDIEYQKLKTAPVMAQPSTQISDHRIQPAVRDQVHAQPPPSRRLHAVPMAGRTSFVRVTPAVSPAQPVGKTAQLSQLNSPSSAPMTEAQILRFQKSYSMVKVWVQPFSDLVRYISGLFAENQPQEPLNHRL